LRYKTSIIWVWLLAWIIAGCAEDFEPSSKVRFFIKPSWLEPVSEYSYHAEFVKIISLDSFPHIYAPGRLTFEIDKSRSHAVDSEDKALNEYPVKLPTGNYSVRGSGGKYSQIFWTDDIPYSVPRQEIEITDSTKFISLVLEPVCGMIIIIDQLDEIEKCIITYESDTVHFAQIENLYYIYFRDKHDPRITARFLDGNSYTILLGAFEEGYINQIYSSDFRLSDNFWIEN